MDENEEKAEYNRGIGERIKQARKKKGITLAELGKYIGLSEGNVQRYESGKIKNVDVVIIKRFADVLGVTASFLAGWTTSSTFSAKEQTLIKKYRCLPDPAQKAVDVMVDTQYDLLKPRIKKDTEIS